MSLKYSEEFQNFPEWKNGPNQLYPLWFDYSWNSPAASLAVPDAISAKQANNNLGDRYYIQELLDSTTWFKSMIINFLGQLYGELELAANVRLRAKTRNEHTRKWHQGFGSFPQFGTDIRLVGRHQKFLRVFVG